jgi:Met-zincin
MNRSYSAIGALLLSAVAGGCAQTEETRIPADALLTGESFVEIPKPGDSDTGLVRQAASSGPVLNPSKGNDFYLAIKKTELDKRWFLSAFLKQFFPDNVNQGAARALGTRVVSFKVQNGKLFVFDSSDQYHQSEVFDDKVLVEAYPIIAGYAPFEALANSDKYILFDPAAGLNKFSITGNTFADPFLSRQAAGVDFSVGVSFMQNFRRTTDGVVFEQVFTGQGIMDDGVNPAFTYRASGTLGVGLRRYAEGEGFVATPYADDEYYFRSDLRAATGTGYYKSNPIKWNIKKGMKPITFYISKGVRNAQDALPDVDVVAALKKGVEGWNEVFGFEALRAEVAPDDGPDPGDADANFLIVDFPGVDAGYAFANWRTNPNTGEILNSTVYLDSVWFELADNFKEAPTTPPTDPNGVARPERKPSVLALEWAGMRREESTPACVLFAPKYNPVYSRHLPGATKADAPATGPKAYERFLTHVVLHEMGHVLGLRHNFKGSLVPPSSSVMDYLTDDDSIARDTPGAYDIAAVKYLYNLTDEYPNAMPFCNDSLVTGDPECQPFDWAADPMHELWGRYYAYYVDLFVFQLGFPPDFLDYYGLTDGLLAYSRAGSEEQATEALSIALDRGKAPVDPAAASADPRYGPSADALAIYVLKRLWLDAQDFRGYISNDPFYPGVYELSLAQLRQLVKNADNVRSFESRRTAVDILKKFQTLEAYQGLVEAKGALQAQVAAGVFAGGELLKANDLLARIEQAITPYFVQ